MSSKKLASLIIRITANGAQAESELRKMERKVQDFGKSWKRVGDNMTKYITVPLTALAALSVKVADTQLQAEAKLLNALKGRKDAQQRLIAQAGELQSRSLLGDEAIIEQQAYLAALGLSERQINDTIEAAAQLSAALGMDLTSAVKNLAKTYGGMTGELGESVPALKSLTKEQLMAGDAIKFVNDNYKGFAETAAQTGAGAVVQLKNKMGDLAEKIGVILLPVMDKLVSVADRLVNYLSSLPDGAQKTIVIIGAVVAGMGPLVSIIAKLVLNFDSIVAIIPKLGQALVFLATNPIGIVITALGTLAVALATFESKAERARRSAKVLEDALELGRQENENYFYNQTMEMYNRPSVSNDELKRLKETYQSWIDAESNEDSKRNFQAQLRAIKDIEIARIRAAEDAAVVEAEYNEKLLKQSSIIGELQAQITALEDKKLLATSKEEIGAINLELATLNKELEQLKNYKPIERVGGIATSGVSFGVSEPSASALEGFIPNEALDRYQQKLERAQKLTQRTADAINEALSNMVTGALDLVADGFESMIAGEKFAFIPRFLEFLGSTLKQLGKALVAHATAMMALEEAFKNPWAALGAGIAAIATGAAVTAWAKKMSTPKLATGGLAYGPTLAVVGDNVGASNDPEVIAPLSKLRNYMGGQRLELVGDIKWELRGDTLRALLDRNNIRLATLG